MNPAHERADDRLHNLVLDSKKFCQIPIKFLGPDMTATLGIDQLRVDTDACAQSSDAAFDDEADIQFTRDLLHVDCNATIPERGRARPHRKEVPTRELGNDVLGDSVAEIVLLRIATHVGEGKHTDGDASRLGGGNGRNDDGRGACNFGRAVALDNCADRAEDFLGLRAAGILPPIIEVGGMKRAHIDRQAGGFEAHRDEDAAVRPLSRLATYPARRHRIRRPDDQDDGGGLEFRRDLAVKLLARVDLRVPPHAPTLRLDRCHQRRDARLVAAGVRNEDVGHACLT